MKAYKRSGIIAPLILNFSTSVGIRITAKLHEYQSWPVHFEDVSCHGMDSNLSTAYSTDQLCYPDYVGVVA